MLALPIISPGARRVFVSMSAQSSSWPMSAAWTRAKRSSTQPSPSPSAPCSWFTLQTAPARDLGPEKSLHPHEQVRSHQLPRRLAGGCGAPALDVTHTGRGAPPRPSLDCARREWPQFRIYTQAPPTLVCFFEGSEGPRMPAPTPNPVEHERDQANPESPPRAQPRCLPARAPPFLPSHSNPQSPAQREVVDVPPKY